MNLFKPIFTLFLAIFWANILVAAPGIYNVNPSNGPVAGGTVVTITGHGFNGTTEVLFGNQPAVSFTVISKNVIHATAPVGTAGTVDVKVKKGSHVSATNSSDFYTYTQSSWEGIISATNQDGITLFDTGTNTISAVIPLPTDSLGAIMTPDGKTIYAIDTQQPFVYVIDAATNLITGTIALPPVFGPGAFDIIVNAAGTKVYVSNNLSGYVAVINTATNTVSANIYVTSNLGSLSITPDGTTVYVSNFNYTADSVTTINTATNTVGVNISTGFAPGLTSITPDGTKGFVGNSLSDTVSVIDIATNTVTNTIGLPAGSGPYGSSILPDGSTIYVVNLYNDTVTVIDVASENILQTIPLTPGGGSFWAASTPDGKTVYVGNQFSGDVTPIDVATNTAGTNFANVMGTLDDLVMSPDPAPVASFFTTGNTVVFPTTFDASASISPIGSIANYFWDFGDGNTLSTASPVVNHLYAIADFYDVVLTVTNTAGTSTSVVYSSRFVSNNGGPTARSEQLIEISPLPPTDLTGIQKSKGCCGNTEYINILKWDAPQQFPEPKKYRIYRDAALKNLVAVIPGNGKLRFEDADRKKGKVYTYYIVSVSDAGTVSEPASVVVTPVN